MNTKFKFYFHKELYVPLPEINPPSRKNTQRKIQGPTLRRETIHRGKSRDQPTIEKEYIEENPGTNPPSRNNTHRKIQGPTLNRERIHRGKPRDQPTVEK
jgi:hypothetical protein